MRETMILLVLFFFMQCTSLNKEEQRIMNEAAIVHNEMVAQAEALDERLDGIATDTSFPSDSIPVWKRDLALWESELVEVPGNEEEHSHKEGEHHHDHQQLNVTAAQMMVIQLELQRRLYVIVKRIDRADSSKK